MTTRDRKEAASKAAETRRVNKLMKEIEERLEKVPFAKRNSLAVGLLHQMIGRAAGRADEWMKGGAGVPDWHRAFWTAGQITGDLRDSYERSVRDAEYRANVLAAEREPKKEG